MNYRIETTNEDGMNLTYIHIRDGEKVHKTAQVSEHCIVDLTEDGWPIGIEII